MTTSMMMPGMMPSMMQPGPMNIPGMFGMMMPPMMQPGMMMPQNPAMMMQHQTQTAPSGTTDNNSDDSSSNEDEEETLRGMTNARWLGGPTAARCVPKRVKIKALCEAKDELDAGQLVSLLPKELDQVYYTLTRLSPGVKLCELGATKKKAIRIY